MSWLLVFIGGGLGSALRHGLNLLGLRWGGPNFPYATMFINITGSFIMGAIVAWFAFRGNAPQSWRLFITTGVLGGYTTFSTFSLDAALLWERGEVTLAAMYVIGSVVISLVGIFAGLWLVRQFA